MPQKRQQKFILFFDEISNQDVPLVGGKNASLGEMYSRLAAKGVRVPNGFAITSAAYYYFLRQAGIKSEINKILKGLKTRNVKDLARRGRAVRQLILRAELPQDLELAIIEAYERLSGSKRGISVAVRSSATAEDLPDASFAGQQETFLNIQGRQELLKAVKKCVASLFTDRAISYREDKHYNHLKIALSVAVQKMVRSDKASSGVMFTLDTESGFRQVVLINSIYGLGENIVQGRVSPDEFLVFKPTLKDGYKSIISKELGTKRWRMVYDQKNNVKNVPVPLKERSKFSITDDDALQLAKWAIIIEEHYGKPMDIEWAKDGLSGDLYIVQARPETVRSQESQNVLIEYRLLKAKPTVVVSGVSVGRKIGQGKARVIKDVSKINEFKAGEVLVTGMTDPDWEPIMKKAAAIVTDFGGRTCHAAIVSRELGIPSLVGTAEATKKIKTGQLVTVDCSRGDRGYVYDGKVPYKMEKINVAKVPATKTKLMLNVGEPLQAFRQQALPNDGVGLARLEFIINEYIKVHPLALLNLNKLRDKKVKNKIKEIVASRGYDNGKEFFVGELTEGIAKIAAAFYPKDVIVRMSDFKSNEYAHLIGGKQFEPQEDNPMLGWRGASRYYDENFKAAFEMECAAFAKARQSIGLKNIKIMLPFVRTVDEAKRVIKIMSQHGLRRHKNNLELYMMVEIPANILLFDEFAKLFDGFSIGSNDLTQLTLGVDRDSSLVSHVYSERNAAVKKFIAQVIKAANRQGKKIGICGQAPSDYPEFAEFLVKEGINSISLSPDTLLRTRLRIAKLEKKLKK